ncbi:MAG: c-type cytochrome, partial [Vicinamibacteria bacterium]
LARPTLGRAADEEALASVIQNGIEGTDMPPAWQISENEVREIAAYVRSLGRVEPEKLEGGDRERGRALFEGEGGCSNCHVVDGKGGILGPDLSEVGLRRGASYLRESLVSPAAVVSEDFLQVRAVFKGQEVSGVRVNEDSFTIQLRDPSGRFHSLPKLELETLEKGFGESLMPSYGSELTEDEIEDLVAYLAGLRGEP